MRPAELKYLRVGAERRRQDAGERAQGIGTECAAIDRARRDALRAEGRPVYIGDNAA